MVNTRSIRPLALTCLLLAATVSGCAPAEDPPADPVDLSDAQELLVRSLAYHDPAGQWPTYKGTLRFEEARPNGEVRNTQVTLDVPGSGMVHRGEADGRTLVRDVRADHCSATLDGREPTEAEMEDLGLACDRLERTRNYYHFLWGLPMKLEDPGTQIDESVERTTFMDAEVEQIRVTYDPEVGGDTWYFYFEPATAKLVGYRFYHDESKNDGEYIILEDELDVAGMRIPANRRWYVNADDRFLGEDRLVGAL